MTLMIQSLQTYSIWALKTVTSVEKCQLPWLKTHSLTVIVFTSPAYAELNFRRLTENQTLELSWSPQQDFGSLTGFNLYHRSAQSQTTVLSMAEGSELRVNPEHRGRLQLSGGLDSLQVNVTLSHLKHSDTGLYMWELSYRKEDNSALILNAQRIFLLVEGAGMWLNYLTKLTLYCS